MTLNPQIVWNGRGTAITKHQVDGWATAANGIDRDSASEYEDNYPYGILFRFQASQGVVGLWDWNLFFNTLIKSIVLLSVAKQVLTAWCRLGRF